MKKQTGSVWFYKFETEKTEQKNRVKPICVKKT